MTTLDYQVREDFDDDGGMKEGELGFVKPAQGAEVWQMNALLGLLAHRSGGRMELDLSDMKEIVGRQLSIHMDLDQECAVIELLPEHSKPATHASSATRQ